MTKRKHSPNTIYNMDETGLLTVPNKLAENVTSAGRGQLVTTACCVKAIG